MENILAVFSPDVFLPLLLSMFFGIFVGGIPGLTATMAVALIIPISYYLSPPCRSGYGIGSHRSPRFFPEIFPQHF